MPNTKRDLIGLVLCGGESTRMGRDKGLISLGENNLAQLAYQKLSRFCSKVLISIRAEQIISYSSFFDSQSLIVDNNLFSGPLNGIFTTHSIYNTSDILVLSCDMPNIKHELLEELHLFYLKNACFDTFCFSNSSLFLEPFPGIYTANLLNDITNKSTSHKGFQFLLSKNNSALQIRSKYEFQFLNANTEEDLKNVVID